MIARSLVPALVGGIVALAVSSAEAADRNGRFAGKGPGLATCAQLLEAVKDERDRFLFLGWVSGYFTAANAYVSSTYDFAPWQPMEFLANVIADQCSKNPDAAVTQVMIAVADNLRESRVQRGDDVVQIETDNGNVPFFKEVLRQAQGKLKELGFYQGGVDGVYGPQTKASFVAFQEEKGIDPSGVPDQPTMLALFYNIIVSPEGEEQAGEPEAGTADAPAENQEAAEPEASDTETPPAE